MTIRAEKVAARKEAVLEAALQCFEELGYEATSIEDIRARSGASIGSIYHHFGRKEVIAAALYMDALERYRAGMRSEVAQARSARSLVRSIVQHHLDWAVENPARARYLIQMRRSESVKEIEGALRASTAAFLGEMRDQLARWIEREEVVDLPMHVFAAVVIGPAQEILRHWAQRPKEINLRAVRDLLADAAWRAVRA
jgi:AcrR family transcriptional regulator